MLAISRKLVLIKFTYKKIGCNYDNLLAMEIGCVERIKVFLQRKGQKIHSNTYRNNLLKFVTLTSMLYF